MTASVRILSTSSVDSSPTILIVAPNGSKILINCGEGTQRCFLEYSQKLSSLDTVCLTHLGHEAIGGLPGALLTYADVDANVASPSKSLDIIGPAGTQHFIHSLRHFMLRKDFQVNVQEGNVRKQMKGSNSSSQDIQSMAFSIQSFAYPEAIDLSHLSAPVGNKRMRSPSIDPFIYSTASRLADHAERKESLRHQVLSFLITSSPMQGAFLADKAIALGVPKGPLYGKLKSGQSVTFTSKDGQEITVESHQVVSPPTPGVAIMVLYYPTKDIADSFLATSAWREALQSDLVLDLVCHLTSDVNLLQQTIGRINQMFKDRQSDAIEHIYLSLDRSDVDGTPFRSAALSAAERWSICPEIYAKPIQSIHKDNMESASSNGTGYWMGRTMMEYMFIPRKKKTFVNTLIQPIDADKATQHAQECGAVALASDIISATGYGEEKNMGELVFAGTASALPCKYRNVTGMALKLRNDFWFLLDAGESTIGNLSRIDNDLDGPHGPLGNIKCVWISHPHADHHLGIIRLLQERISNDPLIVIAPPPLFRFLDEYCMLERNLADRYIGVSCWSITENNDSVNSILHDTFGFTRIKAVPVEHCAHSFAVILDGTPFGRLVYSGDCRPSSDLAKAAFGANLLIHEATFEDGMEAEALLKRHCTIGEALAVAHEMKAEKTILTHFSQRYPKVPPVPASEQGSMPLIFAFDYMRLRPRTLMLASKLTPAVRILTPEPDEKQLLKEQEETVRAEAELSTPGLFAKPGIL